MAAEGAEQRRRWRAVRECLQSGFSEIQTIPSDVSNERSHSSARNGQTRTQSYTTPLVSS